MHKLSVRACKTEGENMNINEFLDVREREKPLDKMAVGGGFCGIFRTIACIGDSLSSGEFESLDEKGVVGWHDYFEYSWGQYMARDIGATVYNFSRGGMTAKEYCDSFAKQSGFWNLRLAAQAYIIALGVNDMCHLEIYECGFGAMADVDFENEENNKKTFAGYYCKIIQKVRKIQPQSKIFVMTMPREAGLTEGAAYENYEKHAEFLRELPKYFRNLYVLDFRKYAPVYDKEFDDKYRMSGHLNAAGYLLTARMVESYIDYIIRANYKDFAQVGFIGTGFYNKNEKPL